MPELTGKPFPIPVLVPDLPQTAELLPGLERIDAASRYTNFGPLVREFEKCLARHLCVDGRSPSVVCLSSCTASLDLCIAALDLPAGGKVLLPAFTFPASIEAGLHRGLRPVLAEVDPDSWQLTPQIARQALRHHRVALVMQVATFGSPVAEALAAAGIQTRRWYYPPLHRHPAFAHGTRCGLAGEAALPVTEALAERALGLPWFAALSEGQCDQVVRGLRLALGETSVA